jgi:uncharacterized protein YbjT (DUF2867 family)
VSKKVVVFGALGLVGRSVIKALEPRADWQIVGVSRRAPDFTSRARFISLDLTDRDACLRVFSAAEFADVTHVVYAALYEKPELIAGLARSRPDRHEQRDAPERARSAWKATVAAPRDAAAGHEGVRRTPRPDAHSRPRAPTAASGCELLLEPGRTT